MSSYFASCFCARHKALRGCYPYSQKGPQALPYLHFNTQPGDPDRKPDHANVCSEGVGFFKKTAGVFQELPTCAIKIASVVSR
jgi:hypothetical protein